MPARLQQDRAERDRLVRNVEGVRDGTFSSLERLLIDEAKNSLRSVYEPRRHEICAVFRGDDGRVHVGVNVKAGLGRASLCAEGAALARALMDHGGRLTHLCVIHQLTAFPVPSYRIVPPCGVCRELLMDYAIETKVFLGDISAPVTVPLTSLLPYQYEGLNART